MITKINTIPIINQDTRDYYCNVKFQSMKIDFEKGMVYNCDVAEPQTINLDWLKNNLGQLFNTPKTVHERQSMLRNERNSSCSFNCFRAEDSGAISPRIVRKGYEKTHNQVISSPKSLDLMIGSDCRLSCTYCLKEYSSAWRHDIQKNGDYDIDISDDRYRLSSKDKILDLLSQNQKNKSRTFDIIVKEIESVAATVDTVYITGGEPFLHNNIFDIIDKIKNVPNIVIFSGLGININRFEKILSKLQRYPTVTLYLSCENIEKFLEFNRYGVKWSEYQFKLELIKQSRIKFIFHSVMSNLSVFGFYDFLQLYREHVQSYDFVYTPDFMSLCVLDNRSKDEIKNKFYNDSLPWKEQLLQNLEVVPTHTQINNLKIFLKEFSSRRNISLTDVYPAHFINWITQQ